MLRRTLAVMIVAVLGYPSVSQTILSDADLEEHLVADLEAFGKAKGYAFYDMHKSWSFDANCDGNDDRLVQVGYSVSGGNGVALHYLLYEMQEGAERKVAEIELSGGIKKVAREGSDLFLTMSQHLSGDPMCCPSGEVRQRLAMCN